MESSTSLIGDNAEGIIVPSSPWPTSKANILLSLEHIPVESWDEIVAGFDGVCQEMTVAFARDRWPHVKLEPVVFVNDGEIVAGALVMIQHMPLHLSKLAVIKWGPAIKDEANGICKAVFGQSIDLLMEEYAHQRGMMLSIMARAPRRKNAECVQFLSFRGFKPGSGLKFPNRYLVNLRLDDDAQRKSLAQKWRYHLHKSEREGLVFERATRDRLPEFDRLYHLMSDRKRFPDHSAYETLPDLMRENVEALRPELFFVSKDGTIVAGALIFTAGRTATYLYGATSDEALPLRAGYFMQWNIVRWLRDNTRADFYDLGGTDGFQGLHQFKKGLVGSEGIISPVPPTHNYATNPVALVVGTAAFAARDGYHELKHLINWMRSDMARPNQEH